MRKLLKLTMIVCFLIGFTTMSWAQQRTLTGVVTDSEGVSLPGVTIVEKGTTNGTITDMDGKFTLSVPASAKLLQFSFVGMKTVEKAVGTAMVYNVMLVEESIGLNEVVAIGYGSVKKRDLTGSVASMDADMLTEMNKTDVAQAMQGRMAGVDVRKLSSKPGAPMAIKIRGNTVIKNSNVGNDGVSDDPTADLGQPLYVVDGIFMEDISIVNPADIEKMDVLKDASATAIYGSRGANGVVIITTKSGFEGKTVFTYDGSFGVNQTVNEPDMFSGDEYVAWAEDYLRATQWKSVVAGGNASIESWNALPLDYNLVFIGQNELDNVANRNYTDWRDLLTHTGIQTNHTLGMSGGQNGLVYNASIGYTSDEGVMGIEGYERYNVGASVSKKVKDYLTVGIQTYFSYSEREEGSKELFRSAHRLAPTVNPYDEDGLIRLIPDEQDQRFINPIYEDQGSWTVNTRSNSFIANIYAEIKPLSWVSFKTSFAPNVNSKRYGEYRGLLTKSSQNNASRVRAYYETDFTNSYTWDNVANFDVKIKDGHELKGTLISSIWHQQDEGSDIETRNIDSDSYSFYNTAVGTDVRAYDTYYSKETLAAFAARLNYNINDKYMLTATGRYDGSSKLAKDHKWAFFPSAAFAWRVSEESFMQDIDWLSNLKLRLSYGESGNDAVVSRYASQAYLADVTYLYGDNLATGKGVTSLSNAELGWEISKEYNIGFDASFFDSRIRVEAEFYNKKTEDAIFDKELFLLTGFSSATGNFGSVRNKGIELVVNTVNIDRGDFKWTSSINFAKNKNEILTIEGDLDKIPYGRHGVLQIGEAIDAMYSYEVAGIWQMDEVDEAAVYGSVPGQYKYVDQNNDDIINTNDKVVIGSHSPDWTGGITNNLSYKNFDFSVMVYTRQGVLGHSEFYQNFSPYQNDNAKFNAIDMEYWTPNNQSASRPMVSVGDPGEWYFEDMSFVKVGNIGIGYDMPKSVLNTLKVSNMHLSLDVQNPFTFTDYKGPDPETGLQNSYGMAYSIRTVLFGLKLRF
ncbi:SusC/RagA family TonB-linked outer membrane protein [Mangrovibacterium sp.]|uniref:SusC/RagA family TonB-linked outer membrane protein n=1 Tax=Mangrovibacterium sp. TaxID=1961364 RepID=UPI00356AE9D3